MNSLIILPTECIDANTAVLEGDRAHYAYHTHGIRNGQVVKIGILNGLRGTGTIEMATESLVRIVTVTCEQPRPSQPLKIIVGVPRPQTVRKVIQAGVMLGAESITFVQSSRGEKSYLQSTALQTNAIDQEVLKALEQIWDTRSPHITVHRSFSHYLRNHADNFSSDNGQPHCLVADPSGRPLKDLVASNRLTPDQPAFRIAIGPERGWDPGELIAFTDLGYQVCSLGERILRVELALVYLIGQIRGVTM